MISGCRFIDNEAFLGGAVFVSVLSEPEISGCEFSGNFAESRGGAIHSTAPARVSLTNCTITDNHAPVGAGIMICGGELTILNTIISFNARGEAIAVLSALDIYIYYSDIYGNAGGDWTGYIADYLHSFGNVSLDPHFRNPFEGDYRLHEDSPCIDSGDPQSPDDPDGTRADMGAYFFNQLTGIDDDPVIPSILMLNQNYPNPFNASTAISFRLSVREFVKLAVYDLLGRKVKTLADEERPAGVHTITFDASDLSGGIYFYRLRAGDVTESRMLLLLK
ncbi:MAG: T9SS type A sorting domain-containing protein [Candidatus Zixiibacteriota bacterium]|nr:MAG: T9SS type A sorting domain-containing protein [candidate division Zixibacteria bacterium]